MISEIQLREIVCNCYYESKPKAKNVEDAAKINSSKYGNWICRVKTPLGTIFFTRCQFTQKWVAEGDTYGMWNELTLIKKVEN